MNKTAMIEKIMSEVSDKTTRDKLLAAIADDTDKSSNDSLIMAELSRLGVNTEAARDYVRFNYKLEVVLTYVVSIGCLVIGGLGLLGGLVTGKDMGEIGGVAVPLLVGGGVGLVLAKKFKRLGEKE